MTCTIRPVRTTRSRTARTAAALLALALAAATLALAGCAGSSAEPVATEQVKAAFPATVTDDASRTVTIDAAPERIVSLAPANTEILFALGLGDKVVGVTTYDDYPAEVEDIPKMGDFVQPNVEAIAGARPDLIVATTGVQGDALAKLEAIGAPVMAIDPQSLDGLYEDITELGELTGATEEADALVSDMKADVAEIESAVAGEEKPSVFVEIGYDPLFAVGPGTLLGELVERAGGANVVEQAGYAGYSVEQLLAADPDVYLATKGSMGDPTGLEKRAGYAKLSAVASGRVVMLDDNLVTRPGPRIVEGLRLIAEALHPQAFEDR